MTDWKPLRAVATLEAIGGGERPTTVATRSGDNHEGGIVPLQEVQQTHHTLTPPHTLPVQYGTGRLPVDYR